MFRHCLGRGKTKCKACVNLYTARARPSRTLTLSVSVSTGAFSGPVGVRGALTAVRRCMPFGPNYQSPRLSVPERLGIYSMPTWCSLSVLGEAADAAFDSVLNHARGLSMQSPLFPLDTTTARWARTRAAKRIDSHGNARRCFTDSIRHHAFTGSF